ncbi:MAG: site-2 protease family protein [Clostridia bacterium]
MIRSFLTNPLMLIAVIPALLVAITMHEYAHGKVAALLGDPTPAAYGRLTLNPLKHLDPVGTLLLLLVGFGWAKPVPVNPAYFGVKRKKSMLYVSLAGVTMNLILAFIGAMLLGLAYRFGAVDTNNMLVIFLNYFMQFNVVLAVFNLIPIPPLDGSKVLESLLPYKYSYKWMPMLERYGYFILMALAFTGMLSMFISPIISFIIDFFISIANTIFF